jgi:protein SCO1/2
MNRKTIFYISFFTVLVVGFYFTMSKLVPGFGKSLLPPISRVLPFSFTNQDGKLTTEKEVEGKVFVAEFFFTTCTNICIDMNNNLKKVYDHFRDEKDFLIVSHTSDPKKDSAARLKRYADSMGVNTGQWMFLTGRKDSLYKQARYSYKIDDPNNNLQSIDQDFIHSNLVALVDKKGNVKKIYDALKPSEMKEMMNKIEKLLKEK